MDMYKTLTSVFVDALGRAYRRAASECYTELSDFIQNLNADVELYRALRAVSEDDALMGSFSEERRRMAVLLRKEYERDGIHLPLEGRRRVIDLQNDITQLSMDFQRTLFSAREYIEVPSRLVRPLPHSVWARCERKLSNPLVMRVPTDVHVMNTVLKWIGDPKVRRDMYVAANSCAVDNLEVSLHALLACLGHG
jgi:intermediate peptidase